MTKKIIFSFWVLLTMSMTVVFNACDKDDDDKKEKSIQVKNESDLNQTLYADKNQGNNILITTDGAWSSSITTLRSSGTDVSSSQQLRASATWISISPDRGDHAGDYTINISLETNTTGADRTASITISSGDTEIIITVVQQRVTENGEVPDNPIDPNNPLTYDEGVIINGIKWATRNVDAPGKFAAVPENYGMFYQWNRKIGWSATDPIVNSNGSTEWDDTMPTGTSWTSANDPCPVGWRVPTSEEQATLLDTDKVTNEWIAVNGITGLKFTDNITGVSLFLPASGLRFSELSSVGSYGYYWSNSQSDNPRSSYFLGFGSEKLYISSDNCKIGFSVRAVVK